MAQGFKNDSEAIAEFRVALDRRVYAYTKDGEQTDVIHRGSVFLPSLTTLPKGVTFSNRGYVYLGRLTTLPEDVTFSNGGDVYLDSLESEQQSYQGRSIRLRNVGGSTMLIESEKRRGDVTICRARYFGGGEISDLRKCYIASQGETYAHGATVEEALRDLRFKALIADARAAA